MWGFFISISYIDAYKVTFKILNVLLIFWSRKPQAIIAVLLKIVSEIKFKTAFLVIFSLLDSLVFPFYIALGFSKLPDYNSLSISSTSLSSFHYLSLPSLCLRIITLFISFTAFPVIAISVSILLNKFLSFCPFMVLNRKSFCFPFLISKA